MYIFYFQISSYIKVNIIAYLKALLIDIKRFIHAYMLYFVCVCVHMHIHTLYDVYLHTYVYGFIKLLKNIYTAVWFQNKVPFN